MTNFLGGESENPLICTIDVSAYCLTKQQIEVLSTEFYGKLDEKDSDENILTIVFSKGDEQNRIIFETTLKGGFSKVKNKK